MEEIGFVEIGKPVPAAVLEVRTAHKVRVAEIGKPSPMAVLEIRTAHRVRVAEIRKPFPVVRLGDVTFKLFAGECPEKESLKKRRTITKNERSE